MASTSPTRHDGAMIRDLRIRAGKKPGEFATQAGLSRVHLWNIEHEQKQVSVEALHRIAAVLQVPAETLLRSEVPA